MSYIRQGQLFFLEDFFNERDDNYRLLMVLDALDDNELLDKLKSELKGRRDCYPVRMLWQCLIAGKVYGLAKTNDLIRELKRNESLRKVVGISNIDRVPKPWQFSRFLKKLALPVNMAMIKSIFDCAVDSLKEELPDLGDSLAIDGQKNAAIAIA